MRTLSDAVRRVLWLLLRPITLLLGPTDNAADIVWDTKRNLMR